MNSGPSLQSVNIVLAIILPRQTQDNVERN
jgi:hypothetical protein